MPQKVRIALDAMGGDHGPSVVVPGAALALAQHPDSSFILFGDQGRIEPLLAAHPQLKAASRLVHTDVAVRMDDKPSQALRNGRWKSSMWLAIDAVKKGEADVAVSAGNTGALMAMAKFNLKMLPGIERPAIAALWPTLKGECDRARCRRLDRRPTPSTWSTWPSWAARWRACCSNRPADRRPAQHRRRGGQGPGGGARGRPHPARESAAAYRLHRLRRRRRHRQGHGRRGGDRRASPAISRSRPPRAPRASSPTICAARCRNRSGRRSAICWRARRSACCATRWIRANRTAACSSASTASSSRAMAAPTPKASPPPSTSATTWCATNCSPRSAKPSTAMRARAPLSAAIGGAAS